MVSVRQDVGEIMRQREDVQNRIIDAARMSFLANGIARVRMDDLACQLGMSKKTVYKHFPSKEVLARTILEKQMLEIDTRVATVLASDIGSLEKLIQLWTSVSSFYSQFSRQYQEDVKCMLPELWHRLEEFRRMTVLSNFSKLVEEGIQGGMVRPDFKKDLLLLIYQSAVQGVINPDVLMQHSFSASEAHRAIVGVIFGGILTDEGRLMYQRQTSFGAELPRRNA